MALRLQAQLKGQQLGELIDTALPPVKRYVEERGMKSQECSTPAGLPLRFHAHFDGDWGKIVVYSAEALLLRVDAHVNSHVEMRLPTDEMLELAVLNY